MKPHLSTAAFLLCLTAIAAGFALMIHPGAGLIVGGGLGAYVVDRLEATSSVKDDAR